MRYTKLYKTAKIARLPRALLAGGASIIVMAAAAVVLTVPAPSTRKVLPEFSLPSPNTVMNTPAQADDKPVRLVYRNSVVPGGVHSAAELAAVIARDPVAAAHYAGFDVAKAHLVRVEKSRLVHVSYRIGNQIFWTKNKVRLALGEALLSDGTHLIRARCGNRLADEAEGPVLLNEPPPEVLETAFMSAEDLIDQAVGGGAAVPPPATLPNTPLMAAAEAPHALALASPGGAGGLGIATLPGVTVLSPRNAPAFSPAGENDNTGNGDNVLVARPAVGKANVPDAPTGPIEVKTELPQPPSPEQPFIDPPIFTPTPALPTAPATDAKTPEPGSALLVLLALVLLFGLRRLRR